MWVAFYGHTPCLEILIQYNADVYIQINGGETALILAALQGHTSCLQFLIEHNADVNTR